MKVLSLFSGVGGFDLGLEAAGMETVFQCEWDKHATKILERHWPDVPRWTDVSTLTGAYVLQHAPVIDVVAWGSPCQDLSVAGKRAGLKGERSGLFHEGIRIIKEIRELTNGKYPRISVWENVAGALSSGAGADFGQVLYEMDEAGACFSEWRMLDAQYFGVPQRRRRVFVVSVFDPRIAANCPNPLLPISEGVRWNPSQGRTARETTTGTSQEGFGNSGFQRWTETDTAITLSARDHKSSNTMVVGTLAARDYKGVGNQYVNEGKLVVEHQQIVGPITTHMSSPRGTETSDSEHLVVEPFTGSQHAQYTEGVGTLRANGGDLAGGSETLLVNEPILFENSRRDSARIAKDGVTQTLSAHKGTGGGNTPMVALGIQGNVIGRQDHNGPAGKGFSSDGDPMFTLTSTDVHAVALPLTVRRLTPRECERLMGWPDDWTAGQADAHRYKQCGNGVASPVAQWIGEQIINL